jgi:hypothetical protein
MTPAKKAFLLVLAIWLGLGLLIWLVKMVFPDAATITWNDEDLSGLPALALALGLGAFFGIIFGLIVAGIVKLVTRSPAKG